MPSNYSFCVEFSRNASRLVFFNVLPASVPVHSVCVMPMEARRRQWMLWNWGSGQLWATMWVLGTEPRLTARTAGDSDESSLEDSTMCFERITYLEMINI